MPCYVDYTHIDNQLLDLLDESSMLEMSLIVLFNQK